jgi:hypothetical protein
MLIAGTGAGAIRTDLLAGHIYSSLTDGTHGVGYMTVGGGSEIRYTVLGDTNLDGTVNFADLSTLATNYGSTNATWGMGDFNYDGTVNFTDLLALATNYGESLTPGESESAGEGFTAAFVSDWNLAVSEAVEAEVPEPGMVGVMGIGLMGVMARRRRKVVRVQGSRV